MASELDSSFVAIQVEESALEKLERLELEASDCFHKTLDGFGVLRQIKYDRLYLARGYDEWDDYCKEVWGISPNYAHKQIKAVECRARLCTMVQNNSTDGGIDPGVIDTERQLRELHSVPDESMVDVLEEAGVLASEAGTDRLTAKILKKARGNVLGKPRKKGKKNVVEGEIISTANVSHDKLVSSKRMALESLEKARRHMGILGLDAKWDKTLNKMMDDVEEVLEGK